MERDIRILTGNRMTSKSEIGENICYGVNEPDGTTMYDGIGSIDEVKRLINSTKGNIVIITNIDTEELKNIQGVTIIHCIKTKEQ